MVRQAAASRDGRILRPATNAANAHYIPSPQPERANLLITYYIASWVEVKIPAYYFLMHV